MLDAGKLRHRVSIVRPASPAAALSDRGQRTGSPTTVASDVPCSIEPLSGRELERARTVFSEAQFRVQCYADPAWAVSPKDYLLFGARRLEIGHAATFEERGYELTLLCAEET